MRHEILEFFAPTMTKTKNEGTFSVVDSTLGFGGHTDCLLSLYKDIHEEEPHRKVCVHGLDADSHMLEVAKQRLQAYGDSVVFCETFFDDFFSLCQNNSIDIVLMDLGVSMYHFKGSNRGFSKGRFSDSGDEALDMRLSLSAEYDAQALINTASEEYLTQIFYDYGEERQAGKWAKRIVSTRARHKIDTVSALCEALQLGKKSEDKPILTRVFQAIRIEVNDELGRLSRALPNAWRGLKIGGRIAVISFHSLEDRIVKNFFKYVGGISPRVASDAEQGHSGRQSNKNIASNVGRNLKNTENSPIRYEGLYNTGSILTKRPLIASEDEIKENFASRSAKLRVAEKTQ